MDKIPIRDIAEELGITKDYALRLVKRLGDKLGIKPEIGKRNAVYLTRDDADTLIKSYEPRNFSLNTREDTAAKEGFGYFYIIQLHPVDLPNRLKIGYTDNMNVRLSDHRTTAPTLKLLKSFPCKRTWEEAAKASITRNNCTQIGVEVFDFTVAEVLERAEEFFMLMPKPSDFAGDTMEIGNE